MNRCRRSRHPRLHEERIDLLLRIGLTREQAERELAAAGKNISDLVGISVDRADVAR